MPSLSTLAPLRMISWTKFAAASALPPRRPSCRGALQRIPAVLAAGAVTGAALAAGAVPGVVPACVPAPPAGALGAAGGAVELVCVAGPKRLVSRSEEHTSE